MVSSCSGEPDEKAAYDAYRSIPELLEYRAKRQGDRPFLYESLGMQEDGPIVFRELTFRDVWACVQLASSHLGKSLPPRQKGEPQRIVCFLGRSGVDYILNDWGLQLLGHAGVLISMTNTPSAMVDLMRACGAADIVYHPAQRAIAEELSALLQQQSQLVPWWDLPPPCEVLGAPGESLRSALSPEETTMAYSCIHHSSGSTGNPKPLPCRQGAFVSQLVSYMPPGVLATPFNHIYARLVVCIGLTYGHPIWPFPHSSPLSPNNLVRLMEAALPDAKAAFLVTAILGPLVAHMPLLLKYEHILTGGAPPAAPIARQLIDNGVHFASLYGITEAGCLLHSMREYDVDKEWEHMRAFDFCRNWLDFQEAGERNHRLVLKSGMPHLHATNCEDGSFDTKDLWMPHPTRSGLWKFVARADDIIVHSNGLNTDPWPIEHKLNGAVEVVRESMVVGAERTQPAVLVLLTGTQPYEEIKDQIWAMLEEVNLEIPTFSRIVPELVIPLAPDEDFERSSKRNFIRTKSALKFKDKIDAAYATYEGKGATGKEIASKAEALDIVLSVVGALLPKYASEGDHDRDFFSMGMSSITATRVRNSLQSRVKLEQSLDQNVVFSYNTANKLAHHVWYVSRGATTNGDATANVMDETQQMLDQAMAAIRSPMEQSAGSNGHVETKRVILLTGATGGLGAHLLHQLAKAKDDITVICPVRADSTESALQRVRTSLRDRALPPLGKFSQNGPEVICFPAELDSEDGFLEYYPPRFAHPDVVYHNAWPVNFNYSLSSFTPIVSAMANLIDLFPHAHHIIVGSIAAASSMGLKGPVPETILPPPPQSYSMGYGRSKWIAEKIAEHAASKGIRCTVARAGQITGDTTHGIWTTEEAPPIIIRSASILGAMPSESPVGAEVNWIPIDSVAWMLAALRDVPHSRQFELLNVVAEQPMDWSVLLDEMKHMGIDSNTVPYDNWVELAQAACRAGKALPGERLLQYFETATPEEPQPQFAMDNLKKLLSEALGHRGVTGADGIVTEKLKGCDRKLVVKMLKSWRDRQII